MNETLRKKIKRYSAVAGSVAAAGTVSGQIAYTDVDPDFVSDTSNTEAYIDLNQDGTTDFVISTFAYTAGGGAYDVKAVNVGVYGSQANAIAGETPSNYNYPFKMDMGDTIDANTAFLPDTAGGTLAFNVNGAFPYGEFWSGDDTEGYLGLKFNNAGATHYGWARMQIQDANAESFTLFDYALNLTADEQITAGQTSIPSTSVLEVSGDELKFIPMNDQLVVASNDKFHNGVLRVMDLSGKMIDEERISSVNHVYRYKSLAQGVYVITATFEEGVISKKVMIRK